MVYGPAKRGGSHASGGAVRVLRSGRRGRDLGCICQWHAIWTRMPVHGTVSMWQECLSLLHANCIKMTDEARRTKAARRRARAYAEDEDDTDGNN